MKIWPIITPIMTIIFSTCRPISNINMQIRYTVLMGKPVYGIFYTHCIKQNGISNQKILKPKNVFVI